MTQKIFLTSAIAMGVIAPAVAEPERINTFPNAANDEFMLENKVYTNAATADNMDSVYEGTVNAVAEYDIVDYILTAGKYLPADSETPTTCPAGSYCAGGETFQYSATADQGIQSCPSAYSLSAAGSKTADECYRTCTASDVAHSKSTGTFTGMFYSNNTNACEPVNNESCENGYHYKAGLNLKDTIGQVYGNDLGYKSNSGTGSNSNEDTYGITQNGEFVTDYGSKGKIHGHAQCSTQSGTNNNQTWTDPTITATLPDSSGQYCYCQLDSYTPEGGSATALSAPWVFLSDPLFDASCAGSCASSCANVLRNVGPGNFAFRAALLGSVQPVLPSCEANTITINWSNASDTDIATNNAGTATYGEDVRTPVKAETIKGKTFKGWKFSKPTTTQLP